MGFRYGKLSRAEKFRGLRERSGPKPTSREGRIRRGDDAFSESLAGVVREEEEYGRAKDYVDREGEWADVEDR